MRRARPALFAIPVVLVLLTGCVDAPKPEKAPLTAEQACAALKSSVIDFYGVASPGSTVEALLAHELPEIGGFRAPKPTCAFQVRPDPAVIPGDVFTLESFYLDYDETMTVSVGERLEAAGFTRQNNQFSTWASAKLGRSYSAAMAVYAPGDGQPYSEAAEHFRVLDLTLGQN